MGNFSSKTHDKEIGEKPKPKIRSNTYFGGNGQIGDIDEDHIEETIRDLQLERLYIHAPHLRPKDPSEEIPRLKLKTMISISSPAPFIKRVGNANLFVFGLKLQAPCTIVMIADNFMNSMFVDVCERTLVSIPIPALSDFMVEIKPDLERSTSMIPSDFAAVKKHALVFKLIKLGESFNYLYLEQKLFVGEQAHRSPIAKQCEIQTENVTGKCLTCLTNDAEVAIAPCGENILCNRCLSERQVHLHHCPFCNSISSF